MKNSSDDGREVISVRLSMHVFTKPVIINTEPVIINTKPVIIINKLNKAKKHTNKNKIHKQYSLSLLMAVLIPGISTDIYNIHISVYTYN